MLQDVILTTALCLSEADSAALLSGRSISALSNGFINSSRCFAICSAGEIPTVNAWAELDSCLMYRQLEALESLSWNTIWTQQFLQSILEERKQIFVNILRVHQLQDQIEFTDLKVIDKIGGFIRLPKSDSVVSNKPVLNNRTFSERKHRLKNQSAPKYPELEELQTMLTQGSQIQSEPERLDVDIRTFLGWQEASPNFPERQDWFSKVSTYGYRSDETEDSRKSNYQAGTDFEIVIRKSLEFLGFTVDEARAGGAGGIDVFCSAPYSFVGECKCGVSIPDNTVEQLDRIAKRHLKERYKTANRFIIGPGYPTRNLLESADLSKTSIMKPESLEKLVEFHNHHAIDLLELREKCLITGQVDDKIDDFLKELTSRINLRSDIIKAVKEIGEKDVDISSVRARFNGDSAHIHGKLETNEEVHHLLVELSSPLTGYLGRKQRDGNWENDRFYYLRDLILPNSQI